MTKARVWLLLSIILALSTVIACGGGNECDPEEIQNAELQQTLLRLSPNYLFLESSTALLLPSVRTLGIMTLGDVSHMLPNPLSLGQSLLIIWPHLTSLVSLTAICFAVSYVLFMRQEIRST